jgi:hypothetical protein
MFQMINNAFVEISGILAVMDTIQTAEMLEFSPLSSILLATITCYSGSVIIYIEDKVWHGSETFFALLKYVQKV